VFQLPIITELEAACEAMPLFPLPGAVFLPHTLLPLHVFEDRYRRLVTDTLSAEGYLAIPRLQPGWESNYEGSPPLFKVAGFGKIIRHQVLPDGRYNLVILGLGRMLVDGELPTDTPYRIGFGRLLKDSIPMGGPGVLAAQAARLRVMAGQALAGRPLAAERVIRLIEHKPEPIEFINAVAHLVLPDVEARQQFLELDQVAARIEALENLLAGTILENSALV
jgi:Lon protease-like protein